jgi:hypothetical protein
MVKIGFFTFPEGLISPFFWQSCSLGIARGRKIGKVGLSQKKVFFVQ